MKQTLNKIEKIVKIIFGIIIFLSTIALIIGIIASIALACQGCKTVPKCQHTIPVSVTIINDNGTYSTITVPVCDSIKLQKTRR